MNFSSPIAYGLDLQGAQAVLVRWRKGRAETLPPAPAREELARDVAAGRAVLAIAVGAHESVLRRVLAPIASADKARRVLPSLLDVELPFPLERCVCAFPDLRAAPDNQTDALAVAIRQDEFQAALRNAATCAAEPTHVDQEALAAWEQARIECPELGPGLHAILLLGADHLTCALARGDRLFAAPSVRTARDGDIAVAAARLAPLLRAVLDAESSTPFPWLIAGQPAKDRAVVARVQAALQRPPETTFHAAREPASFLARALARRAGQRCAHPCNFREGAWEHPARAARRAQSLRRSQTVALAAGLLLLVGSFAWTQFLERRTDALRAQLNREAVAVTGLSRVPRGQEVELARRALKERGTKEDPFLAAVRGSTLELVTRLAAEAEAAKATISRVRVAGPAFEFAFRSANLQAGDTLVAGLAARGWNSELQAGSVGPDGVTAFILKGAR